MQQAASGRMARSLQIAWLVELSLFTAVGAWLQHKGWSCGAIAALLLAWFLGWRALVVADGFRNSETLKSPRKPEHRIGFIGALRLFVVEYWATVMTFGVYFPLERWRATQSVGKGTPVILVHGFVCNRAYWRAFARALENAGLGPVYAVTLEPVLGSIDDNARQLGAMIEQICKDTGATKVQLVGHSMGGLIGRAYVHRSGPSRVARIVTLGSPHHGTYSAHLVRKLATNAEQMCRKSEWLTALNAHEAKDCPVPITSIWTPHDNIVYPQDSAVLHYPNARNVAFAGLGHLELMYAPAVMQAVIAELRSH